MAPKHPNFGPQMGYSQCGKRYAKRPLSPVTRDPLGVISSPKGIRTTCKPSQTTAEAYTMCRGPFEALKTRQNGPKTAKLHGRRHIFAQNGGTSDPISSQMRGPRGEFPLPIAIRTVYSTSLMASHSFKPSNGNLRSKNV